MSKHAELLERLQKVDELYSELLLFLDMRSLLKFGLTCHMNYHKIISPYFMSLLFNSRPFIVKHYLGHEVLCKQLLSMSNANKLAFMYCHDSVLVTSKKARVVASKQQATKSIQVFDYFKQRFAKKFHENIEQEQVEFFTKIVLPICEPSSAQPLLMPPDLLMWLLKCSFGSSQKGLVVGSTKSFTVAPYCWSFKACSNLIQCMYFIFAIF